MRSSLPSTQYFGTAERRLPESVQNLLGGRARRGSKPGTAQGRAGCGGRAGGQQGAIGDSQLGDGPQGDRAVPTLLVQYGSTTYHTIRGTVYSCATAGSS